MDVENRSWYKSHSIMISGMQCMAVQQSDTIENLYSPKIHGRYRQDTDMYKRQKQNNNTQYTLQHGSG